MWSQTLFLCFLTDLLIISAKGDVVHSPNHTNMRLVPISQCGRFPEDRIFLGDRTNLGYYPWMVLLKYRIDGREEFLCGGALINDRYILTAARCVGIDQAQLVAARIGEHNLSTNPDCITYAPNELECAAPVQDIPVEEEILHPEYNKTTHFYDIALLRCRHPVQYNEFVQPICLPFGAAGQQSLVNKTMTVVGWGIHKNGSQSDVKTQRTIPVSNSEHCSAVYRQHINIDHQKQICAGGRSGQDTCNVDVGGPLMSHTPTDSEYLWYAQGVYTFGTSKCDIFDFPGVFTRVSPYLRWILDTIRE